MSTQSPRTENLCWAQKGPTPASKWLFLNEKQMLFFSFSLCVCVCVCVFKVATNFLG